MPIEKKNPLWDLLDDKEHIEIFEKRIIPDYLTGLPVLENPKAIFLAGQPGAGKGGMGARALKDMGAETDDGGKPKKVCVVIDPDELRPYHPRYQEHQLEDGETAATRVHGDASEWSKNLLKEAAKRKHNVVVDGTLGDVESAKKKLKNFGDDYDIQIYAVAVKKDLSEEGVRARYERAAAQKRMLYLEADAAEQAGDEIGAHMIREYADSIIPRNVEQDKQDEAFDGLERTIQTLTDEIRDGSMQKIHNIKVFDRGGNTIADLSEGGNPYEALVEKRQAPLSEHEAESYNASCAQTLEWMRERVADLRSTGDEKDSKKADELENHCEQMVQHRGEAFRIWLRTLDNL